MAWKPGPLPPDTWGWGGVVPAGEADLPPGFFFFASFGGDRVCLLGHARVLRPEEVLWFDNSLTEPPTRQVEVTDGEKEG